MSFLTSKDDFSSLSSGIIGGGGPIGFFSWVGVTAMLALLLTALSLLLNRLNQPLDRFAFFVSTKLADVRLTGRLASPSTDSSPSAYAEFKRFLLNRRRMLPWRVEKVGDAGLSSAGRFVPPTVVEVALDCGDVEMWFPFALFAFLSCSLAGVLGNAGSSSSTGEGSGGGMSVPSVNEEKLKSSTGSSKRLAGVGAGAAVVLSVLAGMMVSVWTSIQGRQMCSGVNQARGRRLIAWIGADGFCRFKATKA